VLTKIQERLKPGLHDESLAPLFRELCIAYSEFGAMAGVEILPYRENSNDRFLTLPREHQQGILTSLRASIDICTSAVQNNIDIRYDSLSLMWWSIKKAGLRPHSDLFGRLEQNDILEIYDIHQRQLFRSFNMFNCISYSLEELFSYEWWELFHRDSQVNERLMTVTTRLLTGEAPIIYVDMPPHFIEEKFSRRRTLHRIQTRLGSPLHVQGAQSIGGFVCASRVVQYVDNGRQQGLKKTETV
jgi:hypothetical protein